MTIKNTKLGGTDWTSEELKSADLNDTFNAAVNVVEDDQTGGSINNSTTETKIGEVILDADTAVNGVMVIATGKTKHASSYTNNASIKLYSGTNASFSSNTLRKTITRLDTGSNSQEIGWTLVYTLTSEESWTGTVYLQITGTNGTAVSGNIVTCESLTVIPIGGKN